MAGADGQRIAIRVLFEGIPVPASSVTIAASINTPATAEIQLLPHDALFRLKERTQVLIFYLHPQGNPDPEELSPRRFDSSAARHWRLLFAGETYDEGESLSGSSRAHSVTARAHIGALSREFLFSTTFSPAGAGQNATIISDRSRFFGTVTGMLDSVMNDPATAIQRAYVERKATMPGLRDVVGPLGGLMTMFEWQFGVHGTFAGANDYATLWARITRLLDQLVSDNGGAATALFDEKAFTKWLTNNISDLGVVVSLDSIAKMVQEYIMYEMLPCPVARYMPGSNARPVIKLPTPPSQSATTVAASGSTVGTASAGPASGATAEIDTAALNGANLSVITGKGTEQLTQTFRWFLARLMTGINSAGRPCYVYSGWRASNGMYHSPHEDGIAADLSPKVSRAGGQVVGLGFLSWYGRAAVQLQNPTNPGVWDRAKWAHALYVQSGAKRSLAECVGLPLRGTPYTTYKAYYGESAAAKGLGADYLSSKKRDTTAIQVSLTAPQYNGLTFRESDYLALQDMCHFYSTIVSVCDADPVLRAGILCGGRRGFRLYGDPSPSPVFAEFGVYGSDPVHVQLSAGARIPAALPTGGKQTIVVPTAGSVIVAAAAPPAATVAAPEATPPPPDVIDTPRSRLHSNLYLADAWFCAAPMCNILTPTEIASISTSHQKMSRITRLELETHNALLEPSGAALSSRDVYYAPQLQTALAPNGQVVSNLQNAGLQTTAAGPDGKTIIYGHERFSGIIPRQEFFGDYAITAQIDTIAAEQGLSREYATVRLSSTIAAWHFMKGRAEAWSMQVDALFTPRLVVGLPIVVIRKGRESGAAIPLAYLGKIQAIRHSISENSASTSISISHVRTHKLESQQDDLFTAGLRLINQRPGAITTHTLNLSSGKMTRKQAEFMERIYRLADSGAIRLPLTTRETVGTPQQAGKVTYVGGQLAGLISPEGGEVTEMTLTPIPYRGSQVMDASGNYVVNSTFDDKPEWPALGAYRTDTSAEGGTYRVGNTLVLARYPAYSDEAEMDPTARDAAPENAPGTPASLKEVLPPAYDKVVEVTYTQQSTTVGVPLEESIRPAWMGDDYSNPNIGAKIYQPILGVDSIIDRISGAPMRTEYAMHCIEDAVDAISKEYLGASGQGFMGREWLSANCDRPVATMADLIGPGGFFEFTSGDYDALYGLDLDMPLLQRAKLFQSAPTGSSAGGAATQGGVVGSQGLGGVQCDPALDPRKERRAAVAAYVAATMARPGMVG